MVRADPQPQGTKKGEGGRGRGKRSAARRRAGARAEPAGGRGFRERRTSGNPRAGSAVAAGVLWRALVGDRGARDHVPSTVGRPLRAVRGEDRDGGADVGDVAWRSPSCHVAGGGQVGGRLGWEEEEEMRGCCEREEI